MNASKSSRYHAARRRAGGTIVVLTGSLCAALLFTRGSIALRDAVGGSVAGYVLLFAVAQTLLVLPLTWYRSYLLERQYDLSEAGASLWLRGYVRATALVLAAGVGGAELVYLAMRASPAWWWALAAAGATALGAALASLGPVLILPWFQRSRPLSRDALRRRLVGLSHRAGVEVLGVHESLLGGTTRRASAALVGAAGTRRILLSDTLLDDYTDDEIEVVIAHEIGHHVHRDMVKSVAVECGVLVAAFWAAGVTLRYAAGPLGLQSPADVAGFPLLILAVGAVVLAATPLMHMVSRANERRADTFAVELTRRPDAFVCAMRRMAAQNLAEEHPTRFTQVMFHTHPTVEERIAAALRASAFLDGGPGPPPPRTPPNHVRSGETSP